MPSTSSVDQPEQYRPLYVKLQESLGLKVDKNGDFTEEAEVGEQVAFLSLGCKSFPRSLVGKALQAWTRNPGQLDQVSLSWSDELTNRQKDVAEMNKKYLGYDMKHLWSRSRHDFTPFAKARIHKYDKMHSKEEKDLVDMYVLYSDDEEHMAVLSVSDYALTVHCGDKHLSGAGSVLKQSFAHVTQVEDDFYEIVEELLP